MLGFETVPAAAKAMICMDFFYHGAAATSRPWAPTSGTEQARYSTLPIFLTAAISRALSASTKRAKSA